MGHGQNECGNLEKIMALKKDSTKIPFELQCYAKNCKNISLHTIEGHKCLFCKEFSHDISECPNQKWETKVKNGTTFGQSKEGFLEKKNLQLQARKQLAWSEHKVFTKVYGGMGCIWYAKRSNTFEKIKLFFMHSDNWGQYGPNTDDRPKLDAFLSGYSCVDKE
jgi:hypothetical protein